MVSIDITELCARLDYQFQDEQLLQEALTHRSHQAKSYERLEFLGDSVLNLVMAEYLFKAFPDVQEGDLTRLRSNLVNTDTLAAVAQALALSSHIILGEGEQAARRSGVRSSILADAMEAVFGAVFLDGGFAESRDCILTVYAVQLQQLDPSKPVEKDAKSALQEWLQSQKLALPRYVILDIQGKPHEQIFTIACIAESFSHQTIGKNHSRRRAEQEAAGQMLDWLRSTMMLLPPNL